MHTGEDRRGLGTGNGLASNWIAQHYTHNLFFTTDAEIRALFNLFNQKFELNYKLMIKAFDKGSNWGLCNTKKQLITIFPEGRTVGVLLHEIAHAVVRKQHGKNNKVHGNTFRMTFERVLRLYDRLT